MYVCVYARYYRCGLQLKLSANSSHIFCRLRAPIKLLELQADKDNYPLQLKGEVSATYIHIYDHVLKILRYNIHTCIHASYNYKYINTYCIHTTIHIHTGIHTGIYIHIYMQTYIHTYIHTYIQ